MDVAVKKSREKITIITKYKETKEKQSSRVTKVVKEKEYDYVPCDYCYTHITLYTYENAKKVVPKWDKKNGGIVEVYGAQYAFCNKCFSKAIVEIEEYEQKRREELNEYRARKTS